MVTGDSETFRLDNLESEAVEETSVFALTPLNSYTSFETPSMKHSFCLGDFLTTFPVAKIQ